VLPSSLSINLSGLSPLISRGVETSQVITITVTVVESKISAECTTDQYTLGGDISILHTRATHVTRAMLDCFAFAHGFGLIVFLDKMVDVDGIIKKVRVMQPNLAEYFTAFKNADGSIDFETFYRLVVTDPDLSLAINDLIVAVTVPGNIAINCGRSIEALRSILLFGDSNRKQAWAMLREVLRLDQSYTEFISQSSTGPRHGAERYLPTEESQQEAMKRSWIIMNRFLEYRKRGSIPLPISEFPILQ
jgi:hypothetical protein